jgi:hypothetical protein
MVTSIRARGYSLRVAATPHAHVHGIDRWSASGSERMTVEQCSQRFGVDAPLTTQRSVQAAPAATMHSLQAQVHWRGYDTGCEDGVGKFEERVGAAIETLVERIAEGAQGIEGIGLFHSGDTSCPQLLFLASFSCLCS